MGSLTTISLEVQENAYRAHPPSQGVLHLKAHPLSPQTPHLGSQHVHYHPFGALHSLPYETLAHIFAELRDTSHSNPDDDADADVTATQSLIAASHVCKHWRAIALDVPALWSRITITPRLHGHISTFAARAGTRVLDVRIALSVPPRSAAPLAHALAEVGRCCWARMRVLSVRFAFSERARAVVVRDWLAHAREPAVALERLAVCAVGACLAVPLPAGLVGAYAPRLRHLELAGFYLPWAAACLGIRGLRTLSLENISTGHEPSTKDIEVVLRQCPDLENVRLKHIGLTALPLPHPADGSGPAQDRDVRIELPNLRNLTLAGPLGALTSWLGRLSLPGPAHARGPPSELCVSVAARARAVHVEVAARHSGSGDEATDGGDGRAAAPTVRVEIPCYVRGDAGRAVEHAARVMEALPGVRATRLRVAGVGAVRSGQAAAAAAFPGPGGAQGAGWVRLMDALPCLRSVEVLGGDGEWGVV